MDAVKKRETGLPVMAFSKIAEKDIKWLIPRMIPQGC
jgi:hypothetical protein